MINLINTVDYLIEILTGLKGTGNIPATATVKTYAGEIDLQKLSVNIVNFPGLLLNWTGGNDLSEDEEPDDQQDFTILICTDKIDGNADALAIIDTLNANLHTGWLDDNGLRDVRITRRNPRPVFMTSTRQVIAYPIRISE